MPAAQRKGPLFHEGTAMSLSEFLSPDELTELVGKKVVSKQIEWLENHHWNYETNAAGRPIVGRVYARLRLAGVHPTRTTVSDPAWSLDLSNVS